MGFFDLFKDDNQEQPQKQPQKETKVDREADTEFAGENAAVRLREEKLDIDKHRERTGEVVLHKEVVEEQKHVDVPVSHEQVVIERRTIDGEPTNETITGEETINIPVSAEKVEVGKHTVVTGEVTAHKRNVEETQSVEEVLHKEVANVEEDGTVEVSNVE
jgi:uncharacterized protein (TIGR02271 family)